MPEHQLYIVMGVSGCGKTTVGTLLAEALRLPFYDADAYHSAGNIEKMRRQIPLEDTDRWPWLETLAKELVRWEKAGGAVLACSALKESYRQTLASKARHITWIHLHGPIELIEERLAKRQRHFMPPGLLQSQFDTLETPTYGLHFSIGQSPREIIKAILSKLHWHA